MSNTQTQETASVTPMAERTPAPLVVQKQQFSLAPRDLGEAMKFAEMMANSELVPKNFRGKPGDVLIAVQMGHEVGLAPMAAIQNIAVINGKPGVYGDAGKAILLAAGCIIEEDDIEIIKASGRARCKVTRRGRPPVERTYAIENAKTAGLWGKEGPWRTNPERQMAWRAFWFAARDAAADLLKGLGGVEELADIDMGTINRETGEVTPPPRPELPPCDEKKFLALMEKGGARVKTGESTMSEFMDWMAAKYTLTADQTKAIRDLEPKPPIDGSFVEEMNAAEGVQQ